MDDCHPNYAALAKGQVNVGVDSYENAGKSSSPGYSRLSG